MSKPIQAFWPLWLPKQEEAEIAEAKAHEILWVQEEEKLRYELQKEQESAREKVARLIPGFDLKRPVL
jgi:hypothetical protein